VVRASVDAQRHGAAQAAGLPHRQPCSAASQPQRLPQAQLAPAACSAAGVGPAAQPQVQPAPGHSAQRHEEEVVLEKSFMAVPG
jgi:hypothetical protein